LQGTLSVAFEAGSIWPLPDTALMTIPDPGLMKLRSDLKKEATGL
jgi:hypothetical protein